MGVIVARLHPQLAIQPARWRRTSPPSAEPGPRPPPWHITRSSNVLAAGRPFAETRTGLDHVSFAVGSRDELTEWGKALRDRGRPVPPISDQPWSSVLVFRDPDNIQPELCTPPTS